MNGKRITIILTLVAIAALAALPLFARPHGGRHGGDFGPLGHLLRAKEELNLSDQQVDEIKSIFRDVREQNAQYRAQLRGGFEGAARTLLANPNDVAAAQAQLDAQAAAERTVRANMLAGVSRALNVLTPEQRTKVGEKLAEMKSRRDERMQQRNRRD